MLRSLDYEVFNMAAGGEADEDQWRDDPLYMDGMAMFAMPLTS